MNRNEAKLIIANIAWVKEFAEGKEVQHYGGEWSSYDTFTFTDAPANYRLKPEPRTFFIHEDLDQVFDTNGLPIDWMPRPHGKYIKVREVLDDE